MQELDAHSSYLDKSLVKRWVLQTSGEFGGELGILLVLRDGA